MWKAIWWGFAGLLLGVVLGGAWGAIAGTLIGSVAGAVHWRCGMCERRGASVPGALLAAAGVVAAGVVVNAAAPVAGLLPVLTGAILAACAAGSAVLVLVVRYGRSMRPARPQVARAAVRAPYQLPAPPLALGGRVVPVPVTAARAGERVER